MKKNIKKIIGATLCVLILGIAFLWWTVSTSVDVTRPCAFCDPKVLQTHTFYEDSLVRGMCSYRPVLPGHCMVVVKRHIENLEELSDDEFLATGQLLRKINDAIQVTQGPSSYLILEKNGVEVGQSVPHVHIHYIPKKKTDSTTCFHTRSFGLLWNFITNVFQRPLSREKLSEKVGAMKQALLESN